MLCQPLIDSKGDYGRIKPSKPLQFWGFAGQFAGQFPGETRPIDCAGMIRQLQVISQSRLVDTALSRAIPNIGSDIPRAQVQPATDTESISTKFRFIRGVSTYAAFRTGALSSQKIILIAKEQSRAKKHHNIFFPTPLDSFSWQVELLTTIRFVFVDSSELRDTFFAENSKLGSS